MPPLPWRAACLHQKHPQHRVGTFRTISISSWPGIPTPKSDIHACSFQSKLHTSGQRILVNAVTELSWRLCPVKQEPNGTRQNLKNRFDGNQAEINYRRHHLLPFSSTSGIRSGNRHPEAHDRSQFSWKHGRGISHYPLLPACNGRLAGSW